MNRILAVLISIMSVSCNNEQQYTVTTIGDQTITLDGVASEKEWGEAPILSDFMNPWNKEVNPATSLILLKDSQFLYFYYDAKDEDIVLVPDFLKERDLEKEDRVEIFLSKDAAMDSYYGFEMDALGRVLAYEAKHYRKFNYDWDAPEGFQVKSRKSDGGYTVEGAIPLTFVQSLAKGNEVYFGAYRAEFSMKNDSLVKNWLAWVDPKTDKPDFHVPTSLGKLKW
jgi:hypothetical protein